MKGVCDSYTMTNNINFINYWKVMVLSHYINETCVYDQDKEMFEKKKVPLQFCLEKYFL